MQTALSTPQKPKQKLDLLLTPGSENKSLELPSDVDEDFALPQTEATAVNPATLDTDSDLVLIHVPNDIDVEKLDGAELQLPWDPQETCRLGGAYEVTAVQNGDDAGVYVLGIEDSKPSAAKVAAVYSLQLSLAEPEAEEEDIDMEALQVLRTAEPSTEQAPVDEKKKKKKKRKSEGDTKSAQGTQAKEGKGGKERKEKKRKHSDAKPEPHAAGGQPNEQAREDVQLKKKKKKARSSAGT